MDLIEALREFEQALNTLDLRLAEYAETNADAGEAAQAVALFEEIRLKAFAVVKDNFFAYANGCMEENESIVVGENIVTSAVSEKKTKWRHDELKDHIMNRLINLHTSDDGEVTLSPRKAVDHVMEYAHVAYWRKKKLAELDINPDSFVDLTEGVKTVTVRKAMK